jgi:hypothetical protein
MCIVLEVLMRWEYDCRIFVYNNLWLTYKRTVIRWASWHSRSVIASCKKILQLPLRLLGAYPLWDCGLGSTFFSALIWPMRGICRYHSPLSKRGVEKCLLLFKLFSILTFISGFDCLRELIHLRRQIHFGRRLSLDRLALLTKIWTILDLCHGECLLHFFPIFHKATVLSWLNILHHHGSRFVYISLRAHHGHLRRDSNLFWAVTI